MSDEKTVIQMVKTDDGCLISDCDKLSGYNSDYHNNIISGWLFDGEKPDETFQKNWFYIGKYPEKIERKEPDTSKNGRYELSDKTMVSEQLPLVIKHESMGDADPRYNLYVYKTDKIIGKMVTADCEIKVIFECTGFVKEGKFSFKGTDKKYNSSEKLNITNADIDHQMFDKILYPSCLLHCMISSISSDDLYKIIRQYIIENIDNVQAKITCDYDFCFAVKKRIAHYAPKEFTYRDVFATTKRQRSKIHHGISRYDEHEVFQMTPNSQKYKGYTVLKGIEASTESELQQKIKELLESLIEKINRPMAPCKHCKGKGYIDETEIK